MARAVEISGGSSCHRRPACPAASAGQRASAAARRQRPRPFHPRRQELEHSGVALRDPADKDAARPRRHHAERVREDECGVARNHISAALVFAKSKFPFEHPAKANNRIDPIAIIKTYFKNFFENLIRITIIKSKTNVIAGLFIIISMNQLVPL